MAVESRGDFLGEFFYNACARVEHCRLTEPAAGRTYMMRNRAEELVGWLNSLDPPFAFLLALPFLVGLAGLLAEHIRQRRARRS